MKPETLHSLIAAGEVLSVEFKGEERLPLNNRELVEAVVCLAIRIGRMRRTSSYIRELDTCIERHRCVV